MPSGNFQTGNNVFGSWKKHLLAGSPPHLYRVGDGELSQIEIGPGLVTLIGGAPGAGKTALVMQLMIDALRLNSGLKVCVCNVEMSPTVLLDRQLARLSGIDVTTIRYRRLEEGHKVRLHTGLAALERIAERLCFVGPPFDLKNIARSADAFGTDILVLDYIQRVSPPGDHRDKRGSVNATMSYLREFSDAGVAVIAVAAVGRTKDSKGRTSYDGDGLSLASFRESSELEFGADDAFILVPDDASAEQVRLRHLKARHSEPRDIVLRFDRAHQSFTSPTSGGHTTDAAQPIPRPGRLVAAMAALWNRTPAAPDGDVGGLCS